MLSDFYSTVDRSKPRANSLYVRCDRTFLGEHSCPVVDCVFMVLFVVTKEIDSKQNAKFSSVQVLQAVKEEGIHVEPWFETYTKPFTSHERILT